MDRNNTRTESIKPGAAVYTDDGLEVTQLDSDDLHERDPDELPGQEFGEGYLMWRCDGCGEMGDLNDGFPAACPDCDAPRTAITAVRED
jgi:rubrerythrin